MARKFQPTWQQACKVDAAPLLANRYFWHCTKAPLAKLVQGRRPFMMHKTPTNKVGHVAHGDPRPVPQGQFATSPVLVKRDVGSSAPSVANYRGYTGRRGLSCPRMQGSSSFICSFVHRLFMLVAILWRVDVGGYVIIASPKDLFVACFA